MRPQKRNDSQFCHRKYRVERRRGLNAAALASRIEDSLPSIFCGFNKGDSRNMHLMDTVQAVQAIHAYSYLFAFFQARFTTRVGRRNQSSKSVARREISALTKVEGGSRRLYSQLPRGTSRVRFRGCRRADRLGLFSKDTSYNS